MEARLPVEKVDKIRKYLLDMQCKDKTNFRELQSLIGLQQDVIDLSDETKLILTLGFHLLSSFNVRTLTTQAQNLLAAALTDNTETAHKRTRGLFIQCFPCITSIPLSPTVLCNFIAKLFSLGYSLCFSHK